MSSTPVSGVRPSTPVARAAMAPGLPRDQWKGITQKILDNGTYRPPDYTIPATMGLESIRGVPEGTRKADYVNLWGFENENHEFVPMYATFVSEDWVLSEADNNFHIDQWIHRVDVDGQHERATHVTMVQTQGHRVLDYDSRSIPVTDPAAVENLGKLGAFWDAFEPSVKANAVDRIVARPRRGLKLSPEIASPVQLQPPRR